MLVIEDEHSIRRLLSGLIQSRGFATLEAKDGREGVDVARESGPNLIILDISMPGMDGLETLEMLKADPATAGRPVVMLSGTLDPEHAEMTRGLGAAAFLNKPVNADVLDLILERYLD